MYDIIATLCFLAMLGLIGLTWWVVYKFVPPPPPKQIVVRSPLYIAPRESVDDHLTRGIITVLLLDMFCGHRDH